MRRWPYTLPGHSVEGFTQTPFATADHTDFENGARRARRRTLARRFETGLTWRMTDGEFAAFTDWYLGRPVNLLGDSDAMSGFTSFNAAVTVGTLVGPDQTPCSLLTETATNSNHFVQYPLSAQLGNGQNVFCHATLKAMGRPFARLTFVDRAGFGQFAEINLTTGQVHTNITSGTVKVTDRGNGWWTIAMIANTATGAAIPQLRVQPVNGAFAVAYLGDPMLGIGICEIGARLSTGFDLFVPSDATGAAKGSNGEAGWFWYDMPMGGGLTRTECRFMAPYQSEGKQGFYWTVTATLEVRYA